MHCELGQAPIQTASMPSVPSAPCAPPLKSVYDKLNSDTSPTISGTDRNFVLGQSDFDVCLAIYVLKSCVPNDCCFSLVEGGSNHVMPRFG